MNCLESRTINLRSWSKLIRVILVDKNFYEKIINIYLFYIVLINIKETNIRKV